MKTRPPQMILLLALLLGLASQSCGTPARPTATPTPTPEFTSSATPILQGRPSATPNLTWVPSLIALPTVSMESLEGMVSDPTYLSGCEISPTNVPREQVSLRGVIPGVSSDTDVKNMLGEPNRRSYGGHQWLYDGVSILFDDQTDVVEDIWIVGGTTFDQMSLPVRGIIGKYGCPELIYAIDGGEEKRGNYNLTVLAYPNLGLRFEFLDTPISLESRPRIVYISAAEPVHDYLSEWKWLFESPETSVVLPWDEAVVR